MPCASEAGHYVDRTEFFNANNLAKVMTPATVKYYAEYPGNSGTYWAVPVEGDALGWSYRKDWFEDPTEMTNFAAKYGYPLAVPTTWAQLLDIAEFFNRPDEGRYGVAIYTDNSYDGLVMGVENAIFSYGGELGDVETFQVEGILNSPQAVQALEDYKRLFSYTPPGWSKAFFVENNQAITKGLAAMSMNYATRYNEAFYQTMFVVKDFWAVPEFAELLTAANRRLYPFIVGGAGTAQETLAADWTETFVKYGRGQ